MIDPDKPCPHDVFVFEASVDKIVFTKGGPVIRYVAEIKVRCGDCDEPFQWVGLAPGVNEYSPSRSLDAQELHAPIRPESQSWL